MSAPTRKPVVSAEATQELQAADVLGVLGTGVARPPRKSVTSQSSIAPVGLDLAKGSDTDEEDFGGTPMPPVQVPPRRRQLGKIVAGTVGLCGLILIAAGIARVSHASSESSSEASESSEAKATPATTTSPQPGAPVTPPAPQAALARATALDPSSSGTVRLDKPATAGHVWLDGKKISGSSVLVSCGTHQIKVGRFGRKHSIDVPCGGEIGVSK